MAKTSVSPRPSDLSKDTATLSFSQVTMLNFNLAASVVVGSIKSMCAKHKSVVPSNLVDILPRR